MARKNKRGLLVAKKNNERKLVGNPSIKVNERIKKNRLSKKNLSKKIFLIGNIIITIILLNTTTLEAISNASFEYKNGTTVQYLRYDRENQTWGSHDYGSNSYADYTRVNPDIYLTLCHDNLTLWQKVNLAYASESGNLTKSILNTLPQIINYETRTNGSQNYNCSQINIDLSTKNALYPGYATPYLLTGLNRTITITNTTTINGTNVTNTTNLTTQIIYSFPNNKLFLNGSYLLDINVEAPPKTYYISTQAIYDENNNPITTTEKALVTTLMNANNTIIYEGILSPREPFAYQGTFRGGEKIYVNGIMSLELRLYDPCEPINESGYYILNQSAWNTNSTCVIIENLTNTVFNFAGEVIDGDNASNGSLRGGVCPVIIRNSQNITIEDLRTQQFNYGICIYNSTVSVFGNSTTSNLNGALISNDSRTAFYSIYFSNNNSELVSENNSKVTLDNVYFSTAHIKSSFKDAIVRAVHNPPENPENAIDIEQWIRYTNNSNNTWAQISFIYSEPMPNYVVADNISIFKYNGSYQLVNNTNNATNQTTQSWEWVGGVWTQLYTLVSPSEKLIIGPNVTNFSVFAPFGFKTEREPEPEPTPKPKPQAGQKKGGGGKPASVQENKKVPIFESPILLNLTIPKNATAMQGEAIEIPFNITNIGNVTAENIIIKPDQFQGWEVAPAYIDELSPGETTSGTFQIAPYEKATPRNYALGIKLLVNNDTEIMTKIIDFKVIPRGNLSRLQVLEYPPIINFEPGEEQEVSFLVQNIGDNDIKNITIETYDNSCLAEIKGSQEVKRGETKIITYDFKAKQAGSCHYNIKFYDENNQLVGFVPVMIKIQTENKRTELIKKSILIIILFLWTLLSIYVISRRRNKSGEGGSE